MVIVEQALPIVFPTSALPCSPFCPVPSSSAMVLADSNLDRVLKNASAIHKLVEGQRLVLLLHVSMREFFFCSEAPSLLKIRLEWYYL